MNDKPAIDQGGQTDEAAKLRLPFQRPPRSSIKERKLFISEI